MFTALLLVCGSRLSAQSAETEGLYFIGFADKAGTTLTVQDSAALVSPRSLARRGRNGVAFTEEDLPVSPVYEAALQEAGAKIWLRSKWMNGIVVAATPTQVANLQSLPFVDTTFYAAPLQYDRPAALPSVPDMTRPDPIVESVPVTEAFYGYGFANLRRMKGDSLHRLGFRGKGVLVAVFDGGFPNVNYKDFLGYDQAAAVPASYDLVEQDSTALDGSNHGATVLSTMAAQHPFFFIGMAPEARYVLFKTENSRGEHRMEELNYAVALEIADSLGVDVVNSSLGYTTFTDSTMNYRYEDLDGRTSPASVAIDRAFARGLVIVTSAGNSGGDQWKYLGLPADARGALAIGALEDTDERAYFSSFGPSADGRIKPDVSAPGVNVTSVAADGRGLAPASGTSLASPLVCGLVACLIQAVPTATNVEIVEAIRNTASSAAAPNDEIGYGLPNFAAAYRYLTTVKK